MRALRLRLTVATLLAAFLTTSMPGAAQTLSGLLGSHAASCSCPYCSVADEADSCNGDRGHSNCESHSGRPSPGKHGPSSPFDPCCPNPACWCHVAHSAYCPDGLCALLIELPYQEPNVAEADLLSPSPHPAELIRPPRV